MLIIDGGHGEGGGQVLRSALSLSALLGRPVHIVNIRAGRRQPGLRPQHVQSVRAAAAICAARLNGAEEHSQELVFEPQSPPQAGSYDFAIGTAGAATLVLQAVLVTLAYTGQGSSVTVTGGTHVAWSPPYHYLEQVVLPALQSLGYQGRARLEGWGFYPKGGGRITLEIQPWQEPVDWPPAWSKQRGPLQRLWVMSAASQVGNQVTARQARQAYNRLADQGLRAETQLVNPRAPGPGTCLFLLAEYEGGVRAGFTGYGRRGYPAERVADDAVDAFLRHHESGAPVDPHLADQLVLPLAVAQQSLTYATSRTTQHLLTNIWVVSQFLGSSIQVQGQEGEVGQVDTRPSTS